MGACDGSSAKRELGGQEALAMWCCRTSDTVEIPMLRSLDLGSDQLSAWVVGQPEAQLPEGLCLVVRVGVQPTRAPAVSLRDR